MPNHLISYTDVPDEVRSRAMLVERLEMVPVECVVRGYITGSGWKAERHAGAVCGIELPAGLRESRAAPEPVLAPPRDQGQLGQATTTCRLSPATRSWATVHCSRSCAGSALALYKSASGDRRGGGVASF